MNFRKILLGIVAIASLAACQKADPYMTLSQKRLTIGEEGGKLTVELASNVYYRVNNDMDWATIELVGNEADKAIFEINVQANTKTAARTGTVRFIGDQVTPLKLEVVQAAKTPVGVSVEAISAAYDDTSASFTVLGNKPWTASSNNENFKLSMTSGNGESLVQVTFPENTKSTKVVAVVTVTIDGENYTVTITQDADPSKAPVDLSEAGTSNCYMVTKGGYYKFRATVRGTGIVPESCKEELSATIAPAKAAVLWSTYNTATAPKSNDEIITGVELKDGYIVFNTTDLKKLKTSNVIIAAYDESNVILWTWHIWLTVQPELNNAGEAQWMDRNIGAINATRGDIGSSGLFFQWGRKDPLRSGIKWDDNEFIATYPEPTDSEISVDTDETAGTVAASIKNPRPFINTFPGGSGPKDWVFKMDHTDLWVDSQKTMFDPCPVGYKLPSSAQMGALAVAGGLPTGSAKYSSSEVAKAAWKPEDHVLETTAFCFPIAGYIAYNLGTQLTDVNACCKVVTSTRKDTSISSYYLNANGSALNFSNSATCGHAAQARCVKE